MHIDNFKLFLEVAERGSLTKVAAQRNTAQSHISRQIAELERTCGAALFRRTGRGVALTEFGVNVLVKVQAWVKNSEALFADIQQTSKVPMGVVKLGVLPSAAHPLLTHVFRRLHIEYPNIKLNIREGQGGELDALLDTGSVDIAILFRYQKPTSTDEFLLSTANTYLISAKQQPFTTKATIDFKYLKDLPLVLPRPNSHWRALLEETARSQGFALLPVLEADSLRAQKEIVAANPHLHALLGPFSIDEELRNGVLQAAKIVNPDLKRYVTLAHPKQGAYTEATRIVSNMIRETVTAWDGQLNPPRESSSRTELEPFL
jgi:LysR family transcriptional regulator, nitrogen assimilation regulatory protein